MKKLRRTIATIAALSAMMATLVASGADPAPTPEPEYARGRVIVKFRSGVAAAKRAAALQSVGGTVKRSIPRIGYDVVNVTVPVPEAVRTLEQNAAVESAEPDWLGRITLSAPADPCFTGCAPGKQWDIGAVNAAAGWNVYPGTYYTATTKKALNPVKVAVLDTEIDQTQADWANRDWPADHPEDAVNGGQLAVADFASFVDPGTEYGQFVYHGSFVAGILGAGTDNTVGMAGFGYTAQIMPVTVVQGDGTAPASAVASGIVHAVSRGARIINLSLGIAKDSSAVRSAVGNASAAGVLVVAAAGNAANSDAFYPAWYTGAMPVTALAEDDRPGACTNFSFKTSVGAPGVGIISIDPQSPSKLKKEICGTSTATPHVSALAALLFAQDPTRTASQVREIIQRTADDARSDLYPGKDDYYGHGRINFERALLDSTPGLPQVTKLLATIPRNSGGVSKATALGTASATTTITAAEYRLEVANNVITGSVAASDGAFDEQQETLEAEINIPLDIRAGVYRLFVRARDANGAWGPSAVAALVVDRVPPTISDMTHPDERPWTALPVQGQHLRIPVEINDDASSKATYVLKVWRSVAGVDQVAYTSPETAIKLPFDGTVQWLPQPIDAGPYTVTLTVTDEGGNVGARSTQVLAI